MSLLRKYAKKFAIWFTVAVGLAFLTFSVAILPVVNLPATPFVIVGYYACSPMYVFLDSLELY